MATSLRDTTLVAAPTPSLDLGGDLGAQILKGANDYYSLSTSLLTAKYGSKIAKANLQNQLYATRAAGQNVYETTRAGGPSPSLLLVAGLGLAALVILKR